MDNIAEVVNNIDANPDKKPTEESNHPVKTSVKIVAVKRSISAQFSSKDLDVMNKKFINDMDTFQRPKARIRSIEKTQKDTDKAEQSVSGCKVMNCLSNKQSFANKLKRKLDALEDDDNDDDVSIVESKQTKCEQELLVSVVTSLQNSQRMDETDDVFGKYIGKEIANIGDFKAKQTAKFKILNMVFDAQFNAESLQTDLSSSLLDTQRPFLKTREASNVEEDPNKHLPAILYPEIKVKDSTLRITQQSKEGISTDDVTSDIRFQTGVARPNYKLKNKADMSDVIDYPIIQKYTDVSSDDSSAVEKCRVNVRDNEQGKRNVSEADPSPLQQDKECVSNSELGDSNQAKGLSDSDTKQCVCSSTITRNDQSNGIIGSDDTTDDKSDGVTTDTQSKASFHQDIADIQSKDGVDSDVTSDIQSKGILDSDAIVDTQSKSSMNIIADIQPKGTIHSDVCADTQSKGIVDSDVSADTQSKDVISDVTADVRTSQQAKESVSCVDASTCIKTTQDPAMVKKDELVTHADDKEEEKNTDKQNSLNTS